MKGKMILAALALAIAASVPGFAQDPSVRAHVPFGFSVSSAAFPAGNYEFVELSQNSWIVRNAETGKAVAATARPDGTNDDETIAKLVFTKYGEHYFLSRVWCDGLTSEISEPKPERAIQIQMTKNEKPATVFVLASR